MFMMMQKSEENVELPIFHPLTQAKAQRMFIRAQRRFLNKELFMIDKVYFKQYNKIADRKNENNIMTHETWMKLSETVLNSILSETPKVSAEKQIRNQKRRERRRIQNELEREFWQTAKEMSRICIEQAEKRRRRSAKRAERRRKIRAALQIIKQLPTTQNDTIDPLTINFFCPICRIAMPSRPALISHFNSVDHRKNYGRLQQSPLIPNFTGYTCALCLKDFNSKNIAISHLKSLGHRKAEELMRLTQNKALVWARERNEATSYVSKVRMIEPKKQNINKGKTRSETIAEMVKRPPPSFPMPPPSFSRPPPLTMPPKLTMPPPQIQSQPKRKYGPPIRLPQTQSDDLDTTPIVDPGMVAQFGNQPEEIEHDTIFVEPEEALVASTDERQIYTTPMAAAPSAYAEILANPVVYYKFNWNASDVNDKTILDFSLMSSETNSMFKHMPFNHKSIFGMHQFYRGNVKLRIAINGNPFLAGQLIVGYIPPIPKANTTWTDTGSKYTANVPFRYNATTMTQLTHKAMINATDPSIVELVIPFTYNQDFYSFKRLGKGFLDLPETTDPIVNLGQVQICVMNQLSISPDASQFIECKIFISYEDVSMFQQVHKSNLPQIVNLETITEGISGALTGVLGVLSNGAALASTVAGFFDKPEALNPTNQLFITHPNDWQYGKGVDNSIHFGSRPGIQVSVDEQFLSINPPLDIQKLAYENPHLIFTIKIDAATSPTQVIAMDVNPTYAEYKPDLDGLHIGSWFSTWAGMCSFWTGDIEFIFQIIKPTPSTVRLMAVHDTLNLVNQNLDIDEATIYENKIFNFEKEYIQDSFIVTIKNPTQWFETFHDRRYNAQTVNNWSNGVFRLYVLNAPSMPSNVVADINVNVFIRPCLNFKVQAPSVCQSQQPEKDPRTTYRLPETQNDIEENFGETFDLDSTLKKSYFMGRFTLFGTKIADVKFKFSLNEAIYTYTNDKGAQIFSMDIYSHRHPARQFKEMTIGVRGSRNFKIVPVTPIVSARISAETNDDVYTPDILSDYGSVGFTGNNTQAIQISVPYLSRNKWICNTGNPNFPYEHNDRLPSVEVFVDYAVDTEIVFDVYEAFGDDFLPVIPFLPPAKTYGTLIKTTPVTHTPAYRKDSPQGWIKNSTPKDFRPRIEGTQRVPEVQMYEMTEEEEEVLKASYKRPQTNYTEVLNPNSERYRRMKEENMPEHQMIPMMNVRKAAELDSLAKDGKNKISQGIEIIKDTPEQIGKQLGRGTVQGAIDKIVSLAQGQRQQVEQAMCIEMAGDVLGTVVVESINMGMHFGKITGAKTIKRFFVEIIHALSSISFLKEFVIHNTTAILQWATGIEVHMSSNQTQSSDPSFFDPLIDMFVNFLSFVGNSPLGQLGNFLKKHCGGIMELGRFITACKQISSLFIWLVDCIKGLWNIAVRWFNGEDQELPLIDRVDNMLDKITEMEAQMGATDFKPDHNGMAECNALLATAISLRKEVEQDKSLFRSQVYTAIVRAIPSLKKLQMTYQNLFDKTGYRQDPFCVCFHGDPGVGKSGCSYMFCNDMASILNIEALNLIYARNSDDEYWSGYNVEPFVLIDDFMQTTDPDQCLEFIKLKSNVPVNLNMAELNDKGRMFGSKFIILTTNVAYPNPVGLVSKEALHRRRDILVKVTNKGMKLAPNQIIDRDNLQHLKFTIMDRFENKELTSYDYKGFLQYSVEQYITHQKNQGNLLESYSKVTPAAQEVALNLALGNRKVPEPQMDRLQKVVEERFATPARFNSDQYAFEFTHTESEKLNEFKKEQFKALNMKIDISRFERTLEHIDIHEIGTYDYDENDPIQNLIGEALLYVANIKDPFLRKNYEPHVDFFLHAEIMALYGIAQEYTEHVYSATVEQSGIRWKEFWIAVYGQANVDYLLIKEDIDLTIDLSQIRKARGRMRFAIDQFRNTRVSWRRKFFDCIKAHPIVSSLAAVAGILIGFMGVACLTNEKKSKGKAQNYEIPGHNYISRPKIIGTTQSCDTNTISLGESIFQKNSAMLTYDCIEGCRAFANVLCIDGALILMNKHTALDIAPISKLSFVSVGELNAVSVTEDFNPQRLIIHPKSDWALYQATPRFQARRSILKHFITNEDLSYINHQDVTTFAYSKAGSKFHYTGEITGKLDQMMMTCRRAGLVQYSKAISYKSDTPAGTSGSVVLIHDTKFQRKILGIHSGGNTENGEAFAMLITYEDVNNLLEQLHAKFQTFEPRGREPETQNTYIETEGYKPSDFPRGNFLHLGYLKKEFTMNTMDRTDFQKSILFDKVFQHRTMPPLSYQQAMRKLGHDNLRPSVEKYGYELIPWHHEDNTEIQEDVVRQFTTGKKPRPPQLATHHEILYGNDMIEHMDAINWDSSPGFPFVLTRTGKGKRCFVDDEENLREDLKKAIEHREAEAKKGNRVHSFWVDCKKDQRLAIKKVENGKCRAFTICPFDYTYLFRKYFLDYATFFYQNHLKQPHAVGINAEGPHWTQLYYKLISHSPNCINGDYGKYDGTLMNDAIYTFLKVVNSYYNDSIENQIVRAVLVEELFFNTHLWYNSEVQRWVCYQTIQGNPSGNPATVILNTIVNAYYHQGAWKDIHRIQAQSEQQPKIREYFGNLGFHFYPLKTNPSCDSYHQHVKAIFYGDDDICAVSPDAEVYNQNNIALVFKLHGLEYTAATKEQSDYDFIDIHKADFLKREFLPDPRYPQVIHAPMQEDAVMDLINWIRRCPDHTEALRENIRDFCRFEYQHGPDRYQSLRKILAPFAMEHLQMSLPTYEDIDYVILQNFGLVPPSVSKLNLLVRSDIEAIKNQVEEEDPDLCVSFLGKCKVIPA